MVHDTIFYDVIPEMKVRDVMKVNVDKVEANEAANIYYFDVSATFIAENLVRRYVST